MQVIEVALHNKIFHIQRIPIPGCGRGQSLALALLALPGLNFWAAQGQSQERDGCRHLSAAFVPLHPVDLAPRLVDSISHTLKGRAASEAHRQPL